MRRTRFSASDFFPTPEALNPKTLRRIVGIKASYYSRVTNQAVLERAGNPRLPSQTLNKLQLKLLHCVFKADPIEPVHHVVFSPALKDRIQCTGKRRGGTIPYWIETTTQRHYPETWTNHPGRGILGPNQVYAEISRLISRSQSNAPAAAPMRARERARHQQKTLKPSHPKFLNPKPKNLKTLNPNTLTP